MNRFAFKAYTTRYVKGEDYVKCCRIPAYQTLISFNSDTDSEAFESWFQQEGHQMFAKFVETFRPTYHKQMTVIREVMNNE